MKVFDLIRDFWVGFQSFTFWLRVIVVRFWMFIFEWVPFAVSQARLVLWPAVAGLVAGLLYMVPLAKRLFTGILEVTAMEGALVEAGVPPEVALTGAEAIGFLDNFVPLDMLGASFVLLTTLWCAALPIRIVKSWIPTVSG